MAWGKGMEEENGYLLAARKQRDQSKLEWKGSETRPLP